MRVRRVGVETVRVDSGGGDSEGGQWGWGR